MSKPLNKNSANVQSIIDFTLDTKPYHSKISEIIVQYSFDERMDVRIRDNTVKRIVAKPTAKFEFFSEGGGFDTRIPFQRLVIPDLLKSSVGYQGGVQVGRFVVGRDENTDLALVPFCYSKRSFDGPGITDVVLNRAGQTIPLAESSDFFQSHGSFQFVTRLTSNLSTGFFTATFSELDVFPQIVDIDVGTTVGLYIVGPATQVSNTQIEVYGPGTVKVWGRADPTDHVWQEIRDLNKIVELKTTTYTLPFLHQIERHLSDLTVPNAAAEGHLALAIAAASPVTFPTPTGYDLHIANMLQALVAAGTPVLPGFSTWTGLTTDPTAVSTRLEALKQLPAELNEFGDSSLFKSGTAVYAAQYVVPGQISISQVATSSYDAWTVTCVNGFTQLWEVEGRLAGVVGYFTSTAPLTTFTSSSISFVVQRLGVAIGEAQVAITPTNNLVVSPTAPLETWNLIQVNPISHTRSRFISTRYGHIEDTASTIGEVTVLSNLLLSGTVILTARPGGQLFDLTHENDAGYTGLAAVDAPYSDGRLAFTLKSGSVFGFQGGDQFFIEIDNPPATYRNLGLFYGYDVDPYDTDELVYNNFDTLNPNYNTPLNFTYDTRFSDYNLANFNLQVAETAEDQVHYRLTAQPDLTRPIATLKKNGDGPFEWVDLAAVNDAGPILPDPSHVPVQSMSGTPEPDIKLYYAQNFLLEYSYDGALWYSASTVDIGDSFTDAVLGISFTLAEGNKPFISAVCEADDGSFVVGGDVFYWQTVNPLPTAVVSPLLSANFPRAILRSDGFFDAPAAEWQLSFSSALNWQLTATYTSGSLAGNVVPGYPVTGVLPLAGTVSNEGLSFKNTDIHFSLIPGGGFGAGDRFTWTTFEHKPILLVHGSVSGWQPPADYGEWYWNGKIGFRVSMPTASTFVPSLAGTEAALNPLPQVSVSYLRKDCPTVTYAFRRAATGRWRVERSDVGVVGFAPATGSFRDTYVQINIAADPGMDFNVNVKAADFAFAHGHNLVVVKSPFGAFNPKPSDVLLVTVDHQAKAAMTVNYDAVTSPPSVIPDPADLDRFNIDPRFVSTSTNDPNYPLQLHSPEAVQVRDYIPFTLRLFDSATSRAHFTDAARRIELISTSTGARIATASTQNTSDINADWDLQWDPTFYGSYLPLATLSNIFIYGTGLNEKVKVNITETAAFLLGGNEAAGALFEDVATVDVIAQSLFNINIATEDNGTAVIVDGPFGGFLPGYSNLPYDAENALGLDLASLAAASGQYDTSEMLVDSYLRVQYFALIAAPSGLEQQEYEDTLRIIAKYLNPVGDLDETSSLTALEAALASTSLPQYISNIGGLTVEPEFGVPRVGMGIDVETRPATNIALPSFDERLSLFTNELGGGVDTNAFDSSPFDSVPYQVAVLYASASELPIATFTPLWDDFETPLSTGDFTANAIEVNFTGAPVSMPTPTFYAWVEGEPAAWQITEVFVLGNGKFRFNLPTTARVKVGAI